jgi:hypothetical protein
MYQTIIRDDIRHREDPGMPLFGEHVGAGAGQRPVRRDQLFMHAVYALHHPADPVQVQQWRRGTGQDAGCGARGDQRPHRLGAQLYIGVQVEPGEGTASRVAQPQRVRLARHRRLDDPHAVDLPGGFRGTVGARVGDHDDVELTGGRTVEQPSQIARDDGLLVVRRYDDADSRLAHAGQDSRRTVERSR